MSRDESQESALTRLTKMISVGAQITVLKRVREYLVNSSAHTIDELRVWVDKEIERLERLRDGV